MIFIESLGWQMAREDRRPFTLHVEMETLSRGSYFRAWVGEGRGHAVGQRRRLGHAACRPGFSPWGLVHFLFLPLYPPISSSIATEDEICFAANLDNSQVIKMKAYVTEMNCSRVAIHSTNEWRLIACAWKMNYEIWNGFYGDILLQ